MTNQYNLIFNNLDIVLNISKYLIEPSILINGHYYDKEGKLILIRDIKYTENQIISFVRILSNQYKYYINSVVLDNNTSLLCTIIKEIDNMNTFWRRINHSIYLDLKYIKYIHSEYGTYSYIHQENKISTVYLNKFYDLFHGYDIKIITKRLEKFLLNLSLYKFQRDIRYIQSDFDEFLELYNYDLTKFKPSTILKFIKTEEIILQSLLNNDI